MLDVMLKKAYDELDDKICDMRRYIDIDDITIIYEDFGTTFDDYTCIGGQVDLSEYMISINDFVYKKAFQEAKLYKIKSMRKHAINKYFDCISVIKHELIHLYLYEKYWSYNSSFGNNLYKDESPIFILYCLLCNTNPGLEAKKTNLYGFIALFAQQYREKYGSDLYEINRILRYELKSQSNYDYFNAYTFAQDLNIDENLNRVDIYDTEEQKDAFEKIEDYIRERFDFWELLIQTHIEHDEVC